MLKLKLHSEADEPGEAAPQGERAIYLIRRVCLQVYH
jgi:hypothetical protein